ncbi:MAG TPA: hypothetical protein VFL47_16265, partial [Flavisolibacter sp.]|nr:hypothetical protein [Flavisolibacter sp.]
MHVWFQLALTRLLIVVGLYAAWCAQSANALSAGTNGWGVAVASGVTEYYSSPGAACKRMFDVYAWPGATFLGYQNGIRWYIKKCLWNRNGGLGPLPASVSFSCKSGYTHLPSWTCVKTNESQPIFNGCTINNGGNKNDQTDQPIDIITGAKLFRTVDFRTADGSLLLERVYNSRSYSGSAYFNVSVAAPLGLGNYWKFWFQHELLFNADFPYNLEVDLGNGLPLPFMRASSGAMTPRKWFAAGPKNQTGYRMELVGSWPVNPADIALSSSQWKFYDPEDRVWTFQTFLNASNGKYLQGRPT